MANGKVITGYSKPYVALYAANNGSPTYSGGMPLARGVDVSVEAETGDSVNFYADNVLAESVGGVFTGATITMTVDGLKDAARQLIMGLPEPSSVTVGQSTTVEVYDYDDRQNIPYVGIGFIIRYMEQGVTTYQPVVFTKAAFSVDGIEAATQEEEVEFQTTELEASLLRDDSTNHIWKRIAADQTTEAAAEAVIRTMLNITGA
jgi:phi13 family phage major tail protein